MVDVLCHAVYSLLEADQEQPEKLSATCQRVVRGSTTYTRDPSQVIKTVQLKPRIDRKPKRRCTCISHVRDQCRGIHTFSTAFFPSLARARSSYLSLERGLVVFSSGSLDLVEENAIVPPIRVQVKSRYSNKSGTRETTDDGGDERENKQKDKEKEPSCR